MNIHSSGELNLITDAQLHEVYSPDEALLCFHQEIELYGVAIVRVMVKGDGNQWLPHEDDLLLAVPCQGGLTPSKALRACKTALHNALDKVELCIEGRALQVLPPTSEIAWELKHAASLWAAYEERSLKSGRHLESMRMNVEDMLGLIRA